MLALVNTNEMVPAIAPIGLDYTACAARAAGEDVDIIDLCLADEPDVALGDYFARNNPELIGLSFRNVDDCFWPSGAWFVPSLADTVKKIRELSEAPIVIGGVGFSIFAEQIVEFAGADFGIRGDGEQAVLSLLEQLRGAKRFEQVPGLVWRANGKMWSNNPSWPSPLSLRSSRDAIDNAAYFKLGGQAGLETKRGCDRRCVYCADPLSKGSRVRPRGPAEVADEAEALLKQGIDVLHLCDSEFNIPLGHARAVCEEFNRRGLGRSLRWYTYMAVTPFDNELAESMRRAGCVGIDFTGDSASALMLGTYRQPHLPEDLARSCSLCRENDITVMIDLLLGGPGETPETVAETVEFIKKIAPDCAGAALGIRIYPNTEMARTVAAEGPPQQNPNIRHRYEGPIDFFKPTFYISEALGARPAQLVKELIAGDRRFFEPMSDMLGEAAEGAACRDHNYNENIELVEAIERGARGAYWDILRRLRCG